MPSKYENGEINLPYFKKGDDLAHFLEESNGDPIKALKDHANMLRCAATVLEDIASVIQQDIPQAVASKLSNRYPVTIEADTHFIWIGGDPKIIRKLVKKGLVDIPEDE